MNSILAISLVLGAAFQLQVSAMADLYSGVLLPTNPTFFIPGLMIKATNGACNSGRPMGESPLSWLGIVDLPDNRACLVETVYKALSDHPGSTTADKPTVESLVDYANAMTGSVPPMVSGGSSSGKLPTFAKKRSRQVVCYAATSVCKCKISKDWCKSETITEEELIASAGGKECSKDSGSNPLKITCTDKKKKKKQEKKEEKKE